MNRLFSNLIWVSAIMIAQDVFAIEKTYRCEVLSDAYIKTNGELAVI
ncbi:hypothetical protein [Polynucleobacter necessarius]|nr:hypothetical protein [Polynucleobacter necessarius]